MELAFFPFSRKCPYLGTFVFSRPVLVVTDLSAARRILVGDFDHFADRRHVDFHRSSEADRILGHMLTMLTGERWKRVRRVLSPAFTSGRLKNMMPLFIRVGEAQLPSARPMLVLVWAHSFSVVTLVRR